MEIKFVLLFACSCIAIASGATKEECDKQLAKSDLCFEIIPVFGDQFAVEPKNLAGVATHCRLIKDILKCIREYSRCLKPLTKQIFTMMFNGIKKEASARCKTAASRQKFLNIFGSLYPKKSELEPIIFKLVNFYDYITLNLTTEQQITGICCGYKYLLTDLSDKIKLLSNEEKYADYVTERMNVMYGESMEFVCTKYQTMAACDKDWPESRMLFDKNSKYPGHGSMTPMIRFANNFAS